VRLAHITFLIELCGTPPSAILDVSDKFGAAVVDTMRPKTPGMKISLCRNAAHQNLGIDTRASCCT
jgi:hypothetical protein